MRKYNYYINEDFSMRLFAQYADYCKNNNNYILYREKLGIFKIRFSAIGIYTKDYVNYFVSEKSTLQDCWPDYVLYQGTLKYHNKLGYTYIYKPNLLSEGKLTDRYINELVQLKSKIISIRNFIYNNCFKHIGFILHDIKYMNDLFYVNLKPVNKNNMYMPNYLVKT